MEYFQFFLSHKKNSSLKKGQSLIELLLVIGLSAILLPALLTGFVASREGKAQHGQRTQAVALLKTTVEAVRSVREKGWSNLPANGIYHPEVSGSSWSLVAGEYEDPVTGFKTKVEISNVNRGTCPGPDCGKIVTTGGTTDPSTKKAVGTISWNLPYPSSINSTFYITRYLNNNAFTETTAAEFNLGTNTGTTVTNTSGGEIALEGGSGNWCSSSLSVSLDLPKSGVANALTATEGFAFAGTGENASGVSFAKVNIGNNPPSPAIEAEFDGYKTNAVFGEPAYAYLATDNNAEEIVIIDLNNIVAGKYQKAGFFDSPGPTDGNSVFVAGSTGFMTAGSTLYSFDLSGLPNTSVSRSQLHSVSLAGTGNKVIVNNNYAYVAVSSTTNQLQIFDVSNPSNMIFKGQVSLNDQGAKDLFVNQVGNRAYIVTSASPAGPEFFIVDTSNPSSPTLVSGGTFETGAMSPKGVTRVTGNKAIIVGAGGNQYQVIDITTESAPALCGSLNTATDITGISSVIESDGDAYSYIITGDATAEFKVIVGGI